MYTLTLNTTAFDDAPDTIATRYDVIAYLDTIIYNDDDAMSLRVVIDCDFHHQYVRLQHDDNDVMIYRETL